MTFELGRALLLSRTVTPDGLSRALVVSLEPGMPLGRALVGLGLVSEEELEGVVADSDQRGAIPYVEPRLDILSLLPPGLSNRLGALPVDVDPDGTVVVAVLDPRDRYLEDELGHHLCRPIRLVRAGYRALREALVNYASSTPSVVPPPSGRPRRRAIAYTPAWGSQLAAHIPGQTSEGRDSSELREPRDPGHSFSSVPAQVPAVVASVTTSTRRFFAGMHSAPSEPPPAPPEPLISDLDPTAMGDLTPEPVFELRRGPNFTLTDIEPPTQRIRDAPAFPLLASLPKALPSILPDVLPEYFPDPASTLGDLRAAGDRDLILGLVEKSARAVARRVALLVVRKDSLVGWSCSPEFGARASLRALSISTRAPSLLTTVLDGGVYLGPLLGSVGTSLLSVMVTASRDVAVVAVRVAGKPAVLVVCDELIDTLLATRHLEIMAKVAGEALERVVRAKR